MLLLKSFERYRLFSNDWWWGRWPSSTRSIPFSSPTTGSPFWPAVRYMTMTCPSQFYLLWKSNFANVLLPCSSKKLWWSIGCLQIATCWWLEASRESSAECFMVFYLSFGQDNQVIYRTHPWQFYIKLQLLCSKIRGARINHHTNNQFTKHMKWIDPTTTTSEK